MIKVRENLYEKFEEETDPIQDMGIGVAKNISGCVEKIFDLDFKYNPLHNYPPGSINHIYIYDNKFVFRYFSNFFIEGNSYKEKRDIQIKYYIDLLKQIGIFECFKSMKHHDTRYRLLFIIKPEFVEHFKKIAGDYDEMDYHANCVYYRNMKEENKI